MEAAKKHFLAIWALCLDVPCVIFPAAWTPSSRSASLFQTGTDNYVNYLSPGILLIAIASGVVFAENQPVTSIVEAIRALLSGQTVGNDIWVALAWCLGILIVAYLFAMHAYKRKAA